MSEQVEVVESLSNREQEVAAAYADGASYKEIARDLGISPTTVRSHLRTLYGKLNVTSKIALAQALADPAASAAPAADENLTADLALELDEAIRRERAMSRVLRIISESDASIDDVIDEVLDHALEICEAEFGILMEHHGDYRFSEMRSRNISRSFADWLAEQAMFNPGAETAVGRSARTLQTVSIADVGGEDVSWDENPLRMATIEHGRARSLAAIPMMAGGRLIGVFTVYRTRVHPFNDRALELAQTFADQAAIAIENARQIAAMEARLAQSTATREILDAISSASDDEGPVFETILRNAAQICSSPMARLELADRDKGTFKCVAAWGDEMRSFRIGDVMSLDHGNDLPTAIREGVVRHIHDLSKTDLYLKREATRVRMVEEEGYRTYLVVPLIAKGVSIGGIVLSRREVTPFSDEDIALLETFAAQAVIAIDNARQFRDLRDRLNRAAATREILDAISSASDDEGPVFDAILGNARKLCDAPFAALILGRESDGHQTLIAHHGAVQSTEDIYAEGRIPMDPEKSFAARAILSRRPVHLPNMKDTDEYRAGVPNVVELCDLQGIRTNLFVPLIKDGKGIGCFIIFRHEVKPFTEEQISLVQTFATQAVIALENVRQFKELRARLDREAATKDVLQIINQNRDDALPVFDAILRKAVELCGAFAGAFVLGKKGDKHQRLVTSFGASQSTRDDYERGDVSMDPDISVAAKAILTGKVVHVEDMAETEGYRNRVPHYVSVVEDTGIRTNLLVPLMTSEGGAGVLVLFRKEVKPYSDDEIALVETFAAQAAIAMENVRQFNDLQKRLDQEAATGRILGAISASREDDIPVFYTILENACHVCNAQAGFITVVDESGEYLTGPAQFGVGAEFAKTFEDWSTPLATSPLGAARCIRERRAVAIDNILDTDLYREGVVERVRQADIEGMRSLVNVPLLSPNAALGSMVLYRKQVQPFTAEEIATVEAFASQAVIAIENARQFNDLQKRLQREAATSRILGAISASREDDIPVFHTILENACQVCNAQAGFIVVIDENGEYLTGPAQFGVGEAFERTFDNWKVPLATSQLSAAQCIRERHAVAVDDIADSDLYRTGNPERLRMVDIEGMRSIVSVPLLSPDADLGALLLYRKKVQPFSTEEIATVEAFASQAVIAIENARQFRALQESTAEIHSLNASLEAKVEEQVGEIARMGQLKQFMSPAVADALVSSGDEKALSSHRALIATLFCDIRGFTAFCETAEPEETIEVLQAYHERMGELISAHGGGVDKRMGDGIMVIFNDPMPCDDPAGDAVRLAMAMREEMRGLCAKWKKFGHRLGFGVGISLGYATVGMVGSAGRFDYTASGTAVNTAARLCDMAADGEILISPRVWVAVEGDVQAESRGEVEMKGIREPVEIFAVG